MPMSVYPADPMLHHPSSLPALCHPHGWLGSPVPPTGPAPSYRMFPFRPGTKPSAPQRPPKSVGPVRGRGIRASESAIHPLTARCERHERRDWRRRR